MPDFLSKPPVDSGSLKTGIEEDQEQVTEPVQIGIGSLIKGKGIVSGKSAGFARKIESVDEADTIKEHHVLFFSKTIMPTNTYSPSLLSLVLRAHSLLTQEESTFMNHITQLSRGCGVPVSQISTKDMARITDDSKVL